MTMTNAKVCLLLLLHFALVSMGRAACLLPQPTGNVILSETSILKNNFPDNSEAFLQCSMGHEIESGSNKIFCRDGQWSDVELKCKKKDCGEPKPSPHMKYIISDGTLFGAHVKSICEKGYYLEGSSYRQCLVRGWSGKSKCSLITCERPVEIEHGKIVTQLDKDVVMDDEIEYSCDAGYRLIGNTSIKCNEDGEYSSPPICKAIECPVPEVMFGIRIEGGFPYSYKSQARFKCEPGYTMNGSATAVCEDKGWSALPECVQEKSNPPDAITKQTTAGITTNTPTTKTILFEIKEEQFTFYSLSVKTAVTFISVLVIIILIFLGIFYLVHQHHKQRGSYNTGEGQRTKEEVLPIQSL